MSFHSLDSLRVGPSLSLALLIALHLAMALQTRSSQTDIAGPVGHSQASS